MRLTKKAIQALKDIDTRQELARRLGCTEQWIIKLIAANSDDSKLTLLTAFLFIRERTGLRDSEIIEGLRLPVLR